MGQRRLRDQKNPAHIQNQGHSLLNSEKKGSGSQRLTMELVAKTWRDSDGDRNRPRAPLAA